MELTYKNQTNNNHHKKHNHHHHKSHHHKYHHNHHNQINEQAIKNENEILQLSEQIVTPSYIENPIKVRRGSLLQDPREYHRIIGELIKTLQEKEIYTLKQIYKSEFTIIKQTDKCYRLCLSFILPTDRIGLSSFTTSLLENENFEDYCTISKLPPIYLTFKYSEDYPLLSSVEYFKLDCEWLSDNCLCTLSNQLITLWNNNINLPIISIWANWLKESALFYLNLYSVRTTTTIIIHEQIDENNNNNNNEENEKKSDETDNNLKSNLSKSGNNKIQQLPQYYEESIINTHYSLTLPPMYINDVMGQDPVSYLVAWDTENDLSPNLYNIRSCTLCSSDHYKIDFINIFNCNHDFCKECLSAYITLNIENDTLENICCPDPECQVLLSPFEIKELISIDTYELYLERLSNNYCEQCDQILKLLKEDDHYQQQLKQSQNNNNSINNTPPIISN